MRIAALAGLFACVAIFTSSSSTVSAEALDLLIVNDTQRVSLKTSKTADPIVLLATAKTSNSQESETEPEVQRQNLVHEVGDGDTLTSIAEANQTTWNRLFNKNEQISHPDLISVGDQIVIPHTDEQLAERPLPQPPVQQQAPAPGQAPARAQTNTTATRQSGTPAVVTSRGSSTGNTYTPGYCTWYAKNKRPDLPNNLGNADTWVTRAAAQGIPTGSVPRVGAIGQQGMHVVYVERVNADGTVFISEMNFRGHYVVSTRTVPASSFMYIY